MHNYRLVAAFVEQVQSFFQGPAKTTESKLKSKYCDTLQTDDKTLWNMENFSCTRNHQEAFVEPFHINH